MKSIIIFIICLGAVIGCKSDSKSGQDTSTNVAKEEVHSVSAPTIEKKSLCFTKDYKNGELKMNFVDVDKTINGDLSIKSKGGENISGKVNGSFYGEEYVLDFKYVVDGQNHAEKILFEYDNQSARLMRSGSVVIEGERRERNEGQGTLDVLMRVDCK